MLEILSNLFLVLLFTVYLLATPSTSKSRILAQVNSAELSSERHEPNSSYIQVDKQVFVYIRGKVLLSLLTGSLTALILWSLSVNLWLVFGVLAFWLNFVPNVGAVIAVALPLPVVLIDPESTNLQVPTRDCIS